nr:hypothetical protein [Tanacetum cinerariifolium]
GAILPIELTTAEIRNSKAYKEYHACAIGEAAPKPKASAKKKKDKGTGSKPGVPDVPSDDSEEELRGNLLTMKMLVVMKKAKNLMKVMTIVMK